MNSKQEKQKLLPTLGSLLTLLSWLALFWASSSSFFFLKFKKKLKISGWE
jgi:hypothetical protein